MSSRPWRTRAIAGARTSIHGGSTPMSARANGHEPELILHAGRIYTVDAASRVAEAVAIRDSRFAAVGSSAEIRAMAGPGTRQVDLRGLTAVPGFVDGHPHMDVVGLGLLRPSFDGIASIDDALGVIRAEVRKKKPGEWIVCNPIGREPEVFRFPGALREGRWPTREDLDRAAPDNPVYIEPPMLVAPGFAIANSAAMRLSGVTRDTGAPDGVEIVKDGAGEPTGVFKDFNFPKVIPDTYNAFRP